MKISLSYWRNKSAPIIARVLREHPEAGAEQDNALFEAYPFGQRKYHPYKVWLDEIKKQRGGRKFIVQDEGKKLVFGSRSNPFGENI